ncbi:importin-9-like [Diadema antillarum]|uniref:importin-9-like n=1 Tax=Diadema antillarum TaxID=105358 RepID=UPI003A86DD46
MAVSNADASNTVKNALLESLTAILSPQQEIRQQGEEQLKLLEVTEEFGVYLAELTLDKNGALAIRQLSSLILKQYVEAHWSQNSEKFRPPVATDAAKAHIRSMLPAGLGESISKVRSSVAYAISAIAHWDWPDAWPDLFGLLMMMITNGNSNEVHGAMRVLTEFTREVSDVQMEHVAPVILPEMHRIFVQSDTYTIRTRGRAVEIFDTCATLIYNIASISKGAAKKLLYPVLSVFMDEFVKALTVPDGATSDSGLKKEIIKALTVIVKCFPSQIAKAMPAVLQATWKTLTDSADIYVRTVINDTEEADDPVDSDGEVLGFENLVFSIFDFVSAMIDTPKFRGTVRKLCDQLLYYVLLYMQITEEQVYQWTADPNQFVEDEDDDTFSYSVRISAQDLLLSLGSEFPQETSSGLMAALDRHLQEAQQAKSQGHNYWWKVHESCLLGLGSIKSLIIDKVAKGKLSFNLTRFLTTIVLEDLQQTVSPFLLGRALWMASRYSQVMTPELVQSFLQFTVTGLHEPHPPSVRISAVRAIYGFCEHLKSANSTAILHPFLSPIMEGLVQLATFSQFGSDILSLVLETVSIVLTVDESFTAQCESRVTPLANAVFLKYSQDPLLISLVQDIYKELCSNEACTLPLQERLIPTLLSIFNAASDKVPMGIQSAAIDILCTIVRNSPLPLTDLLMKQAFPAVAHCTLRSDDSSVMQSGGECLRGYISVALDQVEAWRDDAGNTGMYYTCQVISRLLSPQTSEYTASFVGRLVAVLISKAGNSLGADQDLILRAVLSKMQIAETLSVTQSLIMVFAHLMHTRLEDVLEFLVNVPGPTGKSALHYVMTDWVARQNMFYGAYDSKVSIMALAKLLEYAITTNDSRLHGIVVKGDQVFTPGEGIRTRSKAAQMPEQWTSIPIHIKIYKLLINELSNAMETTTSRQASAGGEDLEDDGWEDEEDDDDDEDVMVNEHGLTGQLTDFADAYPGYDCFDDDDPDEEDDPDALQDPLYQVDLQSYLTDFLVELSKHQCHREFAAHLNDAERHVLGSVGIVLA